MTEPRWWVARADNREVLRAMESASVDSVVCDPPYELAFMGKRWDASGIAYDADLWREVLRVLKPGGHLLAFGGTRTYHRMTCAIEDAGFEIRDSIHWVYGSGFPKSLDVSKAIGKGIDGPSEAARQWSGWGTALKPAHEPCVVARKPLDGTVAANVFAHGTGALNVDGCRIGENKRVPGSPKTADASKHTVSLPGYAGGSGHDPNVGRWPANIVFDEDAARELDEQSDGSSRFFYCAKASRTDRDSGLDDFPIYSGATIANRAEGSAGSKHARAGTVGPRANTHPTVKPTSLMRWLVRLATPPGGLVLDPFAGSGSTGVAAMREGLRFVGLELSEEYAAIARARIANAVEVQDAQLDLA
jgi:site-specific DNA-methyltransferase (adenine-specific)